MNESNGSGPADDEATLEEIFSHAEPRPRPRRAAREQTFAALHAEWSQIVARRRRRLAATGLAAAAALAVVAGSLWFGQEPSGASPVDASLLRASGGTLEYNGASLSASAAATRVDALRAGDVLATFPGTRAALAWGNGSLRIDERTQIEVVSGRTIELREGVLYFDSTPWGTAGSPPGQLVVDTRFGRIVHAGTQFQAALRGAELRVSVREGDVRIEGGRLDVAVAAGEGIWFAADGRFQRRVVAPHDPDWTWSAEIAPFEDFAGRTTGDVLDWVARETGLGLRYGSARALELAGSEARGIDELEPLAALRTLPVMTSLNVSVENGLIRVDAVPPGTEP